MNETQTAGVHEKKSKDRKGSATKETKEAPTEPRTVTLAPVAWGGNWASKITESPVDLSPIKSIAEMFPFVTHEVISAVLGMHRYDVRATVEYFLSQAAEEEMERERALLMHASFSPRNTNNNNLLCSVPPDTFFIICDFLDWCHLPILSRVSRECRKLTVRSDVRQLNCTRFRSWKDWRLLGLMGACKNLTSLSCRKCTNFTSFFNIPTVAPRLTSLNLAECPVTARDLQHLLSFLPELLSLDLSNGPVCDDGLEAIGSKGRQLQRLILVGCKSITCAAVGILTSRMNHLKELDLRATGITNASNVFQAPSGLEILNCSQCSRLTMVEVDVPLSQLSFSSMPHLVSLTLHARIGSLNASSCRNLRHLTIEDAGSLRELNLSGCPLLKELVLKNPDRGPWELVNLNIFQCRSLPPEALCRLFDSVGPSLEVLNGGGLIQLDDDTLDAIVNCCVRLVWLELPVPKRGLSALSVQTAQQVVEARHRAAQEEEEGKLGGGVLLSPTSSSSRVNGPLSPRATRTPGRTRSTNYSPFASPSLSFASPSSSSSSSSSASSSSSSSFSSPCLFSSPSSPSSPLLLSSSAPSSLLFSSPSRPSPLFSSDLPSSTITPSATTATSDATPVTAPATVDAAATTVTAPLATAASSIVEASQDTFEVSPSGLSPAPASFTSSSSLTTSSSSSLTPSSSSSCITASPSSLAHAPSSAARAPSPVDSVSPPQSPPPSPPLNRLARSLRTQQTPNNNNRQQAVVSPPPRDNQQQQQSSSSKNKEEEKAKQSAWAKKTQRRRMCRLQKKLRFDQHRVPWATPSKKSRSGAVFLKLPPARANNAFSHAFA